MASVNTRATWWSDSADLPATEAENVVNLFRPFSSSVCPADWCPGRAGHLFMAGKKKKSKKILAPDIHQFEQQGSLFVISEPTSPREANAEQSIDEQREAVDWTKKKRKVDSRDVEHCWWTRFLGPTRRPKTVAACQVTRTATERKRSGAGTQFISN